MTSHEFKTAQYSGAYLPFNGDRMAFRAHVEALLRDRLGDPTGRLEVRGNGPHWVGKIAQSLSYAHTQALGLVVWSSHSIGVDLELRDRAPQSDPRKLMTRFFHSSDLSLLDRYAFADLWCQKEAWAKLTREGLSQTLSLSLQTPEIARSLARVPVIPAPYTAWVALHLSANG